MGSLVARQKTVPVENTKPERGSFSATMIFPAQSRRGPLPSPLVHLFPGSFAEALLNSGAARGVLIELHTVSCGFRRGKSNLDSHPVSRTPTTKLATLHVPQGASIRIKVSNSLEAATS
jgi:hypothetical protein